MRHGFIMFLVSLALSVCLIFISSCSGDDETSTEPSDSATDGDQEVDDSEYEIDDSDNEIEPDKSEEEEYAGPQYRMDDTLRINHIQAKGTHNSYHISANEPIPVFGGELDPLDVQAELQGVRQFEIDIHFDEEQGFMVYHTSFGDAATNCEMLVDCLTFLKNWSDENPGHHPLFIFIEPKDDFSPLKLVDKSEELDELILSIWPVDRVIRPDDVRKEHSTIREALLTDGWPTLGEARNKAIFFYFDSDEYRTSYLDGHPNAENRVMFPRSDKDIDSPIGAFLNFDDPLTSTERINEFALAGFLVRTRTDVMSAEALDEDYTRAEAAMQSAAHMISTDYPVVTDLSGFFFDIPDGNPSRCNPVTAPEDCTSEDIEAL